MKIKIASRASELALWQTNFIKNLLEKNGYETEIITMKTKGDVILDTPLAKIGGKGLFTKELENAMLTKNADIAVHSLKDVPTTFPDGLKLACVYQRANENDAMLSQKYKNLSELPLGARVGTTSLRRKMQILSKRPDLEIISLRGNVNSRIEKLKNGDFDAIILAMAGIDRLGLNKEVNFVYELDIIPAMGQGALGIEAVCDNEILQAVEFLNDKNTQLETKIERDFVHTLNGGCQAPIGINAKITNNKIKVRAIVGLVDGSKILQDEAEIDIQDSENFGVTFANKFIQKGAKQILEESEAMLNL